MKRILLAMTVSAAMVLSAAPVVAHHNANAVFDTTKRVPMTGVLKELKNINPHPRWIVEMTVNGVKEEWVLESVSPALLRRSGVKVKEDLVPGRTFGFTVAPSRDGSKHAFINSLTIDGRVVPFIEL
jgi:hypothetical protein